MNKLLSNYKKANRKLASQFSKKNFVVEAVPALTGLPPQIEGSTEVDKSALTFDCFHYTAKTEGMVGFQKFTKLSCCLIVPTSFRWVLMFGTT